MTTTISATTRAGEAPKRTRPETTVQGALYPASGIRTRNAVLTECPMCDGGNHLHYIPVGTVTAVNRRAGCGRGRYRIVIGNGTGDGRAT